MAKKNNNEQQIIPQGNLYVKTVEEVLPESLLPYAEFVILDRALPRVEDGLKPVQRRILYTMMEMGLTPDKPHKKSARIVGDCMGKYHPHGDSSVYDAMVRMAQDFNMRLTLVNGHGNFGSVDGDPAAAMRYTEARLQPLALELLKDLDKETVPYSYNFDDSLVEPDILPGRFPNLLVNGAYGIAVGLATNIPTHNLGEVIEGCCAYIDNPKITLTQMMKHIPAPDFSTGGYIIKNELKQAYETGKGRIFIRAKYNVEIGDGGKKLIVITELPYQVNKANLLKSISDLKEQKKDQLAGVLDIVDESDRTGMRAVIYCKKDADVDQILQILFANTNLKTSFAINMVAIAGGKPMQLGLLDIIKFYVAYQRQVVLRRTKFDLAAAEKRCHILEGLIVGVHNIDEVVRIIKTSGSTAEARANLMSTFFLDQEQAQAILDLRLARLARLEVNKLEIELCELQVKIEELKAIIASKELQMGIVKREMREIKEKYPCPRRSEVYENEEEIPVKRKDKKPPVHDVTLALTAGGALKIVDKDDFDARAKKPLVSTFTPSALMYKAIYRRSDESVLLITNLGNAIAMRIDNVDENDIKSAGYKVGDIFEEGQKGETFVAILPYSEDSTAQLLLLTKYGNVKRCAINMMPAKRNCAQYMPLEKGDEIVCAEIYDDDYASNLVMVTKGGMCLNASKQELIVAGRASSGRTAIKLDKGDEVIFATQHTGEGELLIVTSLGTCKRVILMAINVITSLNRKGVMIANIKGRGNILFAEHVTVPYECAIIGEDKSISPFNTEDIMLGDTYTLGKTLYSNPIKAIYALKHRSEFPDGNVQLKF